MNLILLAFINTLLQFAWITGTLAVTGFLLTWLSRWTCNVHRQFVFPRFGLYTFGSIGIPVHEMSHAVFCLLFRLEVKKIKWFDPSGRNGAHGAVEHLYEPWNVWHRLGHVFVGFAPVLLAPPLIALLFFILVPGANTGVAWHSASISTDPLFLQAFGTTIRSCVLALTAKVNFDSPGFYVFLYLAFAIVSQLELSKEDIRLARSGSLGLFVVLLLVNGAAALFNADLQPRFNAWGGRLLVSWVSLFSIAALLSLVNLLFCYLCMNVINRISGRDSIRPFRI